MATKEFQDNILILPDTLIPHLQRLERLIAKELSSLYYSLNYCKNEISYYFPISEKETSEGRLNFEILNIKRNEYRRILEHIKKLEKTQKEIRYITRNQ